MRKILLLEKNSFFCEVLQNLLQNRFPEVEIKVAPCHEECLAEMRNFKPHILFLSLNQADGKDGLELLSEIRKIDATVTIIILGEYDFSEYRKVAILEGANHFISKETWTGNEILALTKTILGIPLASGQEDNGYEYDGKTTKKENLERPLERRKKNTKGQAMERKYLKDHSDRRNKEVIR